VTKSRFMLLAIVAGLLLGAWSATPLRAQSIYGTITGTVSDQSGAVAPGADVSLKNVATGSVRKTTTNSEGYFSYSSVPTGTYNLSAKIQGFQMSTTEGIQVSGASVLSFDFKLQIESTATQIEVTTNADQIIPTDSGEKAITLTTKQLQDFTIVGANAAEFIKILPGFAQRNNGDPMKTGTDFGGQVVGINGNGDGGSQSPLNGAFVANGTGTGSIDITADGAHVSDPGCNCATPVNPNTDMIQEFKVLTSNFSAENSKGPIVINSVAKSGGHDFHGLASMDIRDYKMNSNSWVNNFTGTAKPQNRFLYPQFQIGGPVLIPGTDFNKNRDKLYFFSAFEYYFQKLDTGLLGATVPTAGMRNGDFSPAELANLGNVTASGGAPSQIAPCLSTGVVIPQFDPSSVAANPLDSTKWTECANFGTPTPYPGGMISATQLNPLYPALNPSGQGLMNLYPLPNADPNGTGGYNYVKDVLFDQNSWQWMSRVDYSISDNTKLYVRYNLQKETQQFPIGLWWRNATQVPYPTPVLGKNVSDSVSASLTHVFSPTMSNEFVFGYTYIDFPNVFQDPKKVSKSALGIPLTGIFKNGIDQIPSVTGWGGEFGTYLNPSGFQLGGSQGLFAKKHLPSVSDNLSKVWGTHTAKFGIYYEYVINNQPSNNYGNGLIIEANWAGGSSGNPYADLLRGFAGQYTESNKDVLHNEGYNTMEFFATDSWKATRRLTLDYGLRVSHLGAWYDRLGNGFAIFNPALYDNNADPNSGTGFDWHGQNSSIPLSGFPNRALFYAPRFGAAFDLFGTGRTVLRGGWGQFYYHNAQFTQGLDTPLGVQTPTLNSVTFADIEATVPGTAPFSASGVSGTDDHTPRTTSYSFTISQRLPFSSLLEASYVGNKSRYLLNQNGVGTNANVIPYGTLFGTGENLSSLGAGEYKYGPFPIYQAIPVANHNNYSNYNALQVSWVRQKGRYDFTLNYTFSKALGQVGLNQINLADDYGAQPFDRRHIFNAAYSIELGGPVHNNKLLAGFVNGWQLSGITQFQSGVNLTGTSINQNFNASGNISSDLTTTDGFSINSQSINGTDQIPLAPYLTCNPRANLGPNQWVNGNCFAIPTSPGQNGPTVLPEIFGPSFFNSDLALFKNFQISESRKLQLRFSAYNFANHPIWSFAGNGVGSSATNLNFDANGAQTNTGFGTAPIKQGNRVLQISAKFYF
jgi:Carboxypeptidase regulatory-like domain